MDIKRISDNQVRCAITEQEIEELGFNIDEIIGNTEETQKFMRVILEKIEEQEVIDVELLSPMVRAELLPDHSMNIIFGGITEEEKKTMFDKVMSMMERLSGKADALGGQALQSAKGVSKEKQASKAVEEGTLGQAEEEDFFIGSTPFALEFDKLDKVIYISKLFTGKEEIPQSSLYKMKDCYYLILELEDFAKAKLRPLAFAAVEYNSRQIAAEAGISYIKEHGKCVISKNAIEQLMQL